MLFGGCISNRRMGNLKLLTQNDFKPNIQNLIFYYC